MLVFKGKPSEPVKKNPKHPLVKSNQIFSLCRKKGPEQWKYAEKSYYWCLEKAYLLWSIT